MLCSFFAGCLGIWGLVKFLTYKYIFEHVLSPFYWYLVVTLIVLSFILLAYFIIMAIYWRCIEKPKADREREMLRDQQQLTSDQYRRYGDTPKLSKVSESPMRRMEDV